MVLSLWKRILFWLVLWSPFHFQCSPSCFLLLATIYLTMNPSLGELNLPLSWEQQGCSCWQPSLAAPITVQGLRALTHGIWLLHYLDDLVHWVCGRGSYEHLPQNKPSFPEAFTAHEPSAMLNPSCSVERHLRWWQRGVATAVQAWAPQQRPQSSLLARANQERQHCSSPLKEPLPKHLFLPLHLCNSTFKENILSQMI